MKQILLPIKNIVLHTTEKLNGVMLVVYVYIYNIINKGRIK